MKFNKENIAKLAKGEVVLKNNGTLEQLCAVMKEAFPEDDTIPNGRSNFYGVDASYSKEWDASYSIDDRIIPILSVSEFFIEEWTPQFGELVEVSNDGIDWIVISPEAFLSETRQVDYPFRTTHQIDSLKRGDVVKDSHWGYIRQIKKETISIEEAEERLNVKIER